MTSKLTTERVQDRPLADQWSDFELMSLAEAAQLFWPPVAGRRGFITEETLRSAVREGRLPVSRIARKIYVNKAALRELSVCERVSTPSPSDSVDEEDDLLSALDGAAAWRGPQAARSNGR